MDDHLDYLNNGSNGNFDNDNSDEHLDFSLVNEVVEELVFTSNHGTSPENESSSPKDSDSDYHPSDAELAEPESESSIDDAESEAESISIPILPKSVPQPIPKRVQSNSTTSCVNPTSVKVKRKGKQRDGPPSKNSEFKF